MVEYCKMFPSHPSATAVNPCLFMSPSEVMNWDTKKSMKRMLSTAGKPKLCKNLLNASYL